MFLTLLGIRLIWNRQINLFNGAMDVLKKQPIEMQAHVADDVTKCMWEIDKKAMQQSDHENYRMFVYFWKEYVNIRKSFPSQVTASNAEYASAVLLETWCVGNILGVRSADEISRVIFAWSNPLQDYLLNETIEHWKNQIPQPNETEQDEYSAHYELHDKDVVKEIEDEQQVDNLNDLTHRLAEFKLKKELGLIGNWQSSSQNITVSAPNNSIDQPLERNTADSGLHSNKSLPVQQPVSTKWIFYTQSGMLFNSSNGSKYTPMQYKRVQGPVNGYEIMHGKDLWANDFDITFMQGKDGPEDSTAQSRI